MPSLSLSLREIPVDNPHKKNKETEAETKESLQPKGLYLPPPRSTKRVAREREHGDRSGVHTRGHRRPPYTSRAIGWFSRLAAQTVWHTRLIDNRGELERLAPAVRVVFPDARPAKGVLDVGRPVMRRGHLRWTLSRTHRSNTVCNKGCCKTPARRPHPRPRNRVLQQPF